MLHHPTYEGLRSLRLDGMAEALAELEAGSFGDGLSPAEWLGVLVDRERSLRESKRYERRLREARLRHAGARPESVDYRTRRGLDRGLFERLCGGRWTAEGRNLILTRPCGVGKAWLCCALAQASYRREGESALYRRSGRLIWELVVARGDGSYPRLYRNLSKAHFLVLDDFGPDPLTAEQRRDLMELVEERSGRVSTAILSQLPLSSWHDLIGEPTDADAILDRLVHSAYRLELDGPSLRRAAAAEGKDEKPGFALPEGGEALAVDGGNGFASPHAEPTLPGGKVTLTPACAGGVASERSGS